jgi:hypothetical protein
MTYTVESISQYKAKCQAGAQARVTEQLQRVAEVALRQLSNHPLEDVAQEALILRIFEIHGPMKENDLRQEWATRIQRHGSAIAALVFLDHKPRHPASGTVRT